MIDTDMMKAGIEVTHWQRFRGGTGTPVTQAMVNAVKDLIDNDGTGTKTALEDRAAWRYEFTGPAEYVRPVIAAFMHFIASVDGAP